MALQSQTDVSYLYTYTLTNIVSSEMFSGIITCIYPIGILSQGNASRKAGNNLYVISQRIFTILILSNS